MANPRLLQALIKRLGGGDSTKPSGLSDVIPKPATKPVPQKGSIGPGPETFAEGAETLEEKGLNQFQRTFIEEAELDPTKPSTFDQPARVFEDVPPDIPDIGPPRPQRPTTAIELRGREARAEARSDFPPDELDAPRPRDVEVDDAAQQVFDQIQDLEDALVLPQPSSQANRRGVRDSKKLLQNFKREASQTAAEARKTENPALLQALLDRLAAPSKTKAPSNIEKILRLREQRRPNR